MCEKLWKWKNFMHFLTLFYVSVFNRYRPIMQLSYRYRHRYRPIWKSDISVVIGIGRYEKMLIGRPLLQHFGKMSSKYFLPSFLKKIHTESYSRTLLNYPFSADSEWLKNETRILITFFPPLELINSLSKLELLKIKC